MNTPLVLSTLSSAYFAEGITRHLGSTLGAIERKTFGNGESYYRIAVNDRFELVGRTIIFVGCTQTDADILEIFRVGTELAAHGARRIIFAIPFFGYSTMERAGMRGEVVTAKANALLLSRIPSGDFPNCFIMMDLHTLGIIQYFEGNSLRLHLSSRDILIEEMASLGLSEFMFGSADIGRAPWVRGFARHFGVPIALIDKRRESEETEVLNVVGDVIRKKMIIYDDMIRSGDSLLKAIGAYGGRGVEEVYIAASHLDLTNPGVAALVTAEPVRKVIATNSHPMSQHPAVVNSPKFEIRDVSGIFGEAIARMLV